jgi:AAA ATPase domain
MVDRDRHLLDRRGETELLDQLVDAVRSGASRALVVRGEPGVGKTALLDHLARAATGCRVVRVAGVQAERELAFAGLHQVCAPLWDRLPRLPGPQREALSTAFGLAVGPPPDRFLVGLAALGLLSEAARQRPLVCLVDDAQWLDVASAQALGFVARRLLAESVALVFAVRDLEQREVLAGLPELALHGLDDEQARELLRTAPLGPVDAGVVDRIVAEARGNPLALLELPRGFSPAELAGGFGLPGTAASPARIEESYRRQVAPLPAATRRLLLLAAAEPVGDPVLVWRPPHRRSRPSWWTSTSGCGSATRCSARPSTGRPGRRNDAARTAPWRRPPNPRPIPIAVPGTPPRRWPGRTSTSPPISSSRPGVPRSAAGWPLQRPSWNARPS